MFHSTTDPAEPTGPDGLVDFEFDLTEGETRRRAQVMAALGDTWDPVEVLRGEEEAHALLYSGLDEQQQRIHDDLVAAGVLPRQGRGHASP
ncbi:DUF6400 family protein [Kitasatospora sp. NPDC059571]|uniref:DUF6400 family protein n=1 Tax=Kitasatospora sp. NPDC059571 TaxID=3346871 RepID=UPI003695D0E5